MWTLVFRTVCDTRIDALWRVAKIQRGVSFRALDDTIYTEQPSAFDLPTARIAPRISTIHISFGYSAGNNQDSHMNTCLRSHKIGLGMVETRISRC
jgi:hypothetical protein